MKNMLKTLSIDNFKGFSHLEFDGISRLNLIVGKNNCGKTTLLEAVFLHTAAHKPQNIIKINQFRGLEFSQSSDCLTIFHGFDLKEEGTNNTPIIQSTDENGKTIEQRFAPLFRTSAEDDDTTRRYVLPNEANGNAMLEDAKTKAGPTANLEGLIIDITANGSHFESRLRFRPDGIEVFEPKGYPEKQIAFYHSPIVSRLNQHNLSGYDEIVRLKRKQGLIEALQGIEPSVNDIDRVGTGIFLDIGYPHLVPIQLLGGGLTTLFFLLTNLPIAQDGIALIDEIDNGLRHSVQVELWKLLLAYSKLYNVQVFATTHSLDCVRSFDEFSAPGEKALFRIGRSKDSHTMFHYDEERLSIAVERDWEVR